ncbi:MAG: glutamate 5-kinase [Chloroflexota bacterium]|nr:glutamate 5-kinase [Chloroflexota bacterium]MDE2961670.1 glutamate 5-kinase [Chloroflexota bacterium]
MSTSRHMTYPATLPLEPGEATHTSPYHRIVVKAGTSVLTGESGNALDLNVMRDLVSQIAELQGVDGAQMLLVTSGAIAAGRQSAAENPVIPDIPTRQVFAALGQSRLMHIYADLFASHGIGVAQVLLTLHDLSQRQSYLNVRNTLLSLLDLGVVPIVNENDVVAADEIGEIFGDNDRLSSLIAALIDADLLIILSDVDGLYTADPGSDPTATRIETVDSVDDGVFAMAGEHRNAWARGGMPTKLHAAHLVTTSGIAMAICRGRNPDALLSVARGEPVGTFFKPAQGKLEARKRWMLSRVGDTDWGQVVVDDGAVAALRRGAVSLLPAGVRNVVGEFTRGDIIYVSDLADSHVACGIANYSAADVGRIQGMRSDRIVDTLGYHYGQEVIHRNNLVLL